MIVIYMIIHIYKHLKNTECVAPVAAVISVTVQSAWFVT